MIARVTYIDILLLPVYLTFIYLFASSVQRKNAHNPIYKYYWRGLLAKITGAISVCLIYLYYYKGGDTTDYFESALAMINMFFKDKETFFSIMRGNLSAANFSGFDYNTGWPAGHMWKDEKTFFVVRFITPLAFLGAKSFMLTSVVLAWITYGGVWRLYRLFCELFPPLWKQFAVAVLFIPSVVFWGSGILKDTITLSFACWFTYSFYYAVMKREKMILNWIMLIASSFIIISVKPYIFLALLPGTMLWVSFKKIQSVKSTLVRFIVAPSIISVFAFLGYWIITSLVGEAMGDYQLDSVLDKAVITQQDLRKEEAYGSNKFEIGEFDASLGSIITKAPVAIIAALYRPFLWEARNPVMLISALENTLILGLTLWLLYKIGVFGFVRLISKHPVLIFAFSFSLVFAFGTGLSTANFGALVRYKIPAMPYFLSSLFILKYYYDTRAKGIGI